MQIDRIVIQPTFENLIVQYSDASGRSNNFTLSTVNNPNVAAIVNEAQSRLPVDSQNPAKPEIEREILEDRIQKLRAAIGVS
jgi:hypothetical protein